jgi:hypothetical protein
MITTQLVERLGSHGCVQSALLVPRALPGLVSMHSEGSRVGTNLQKPCICADMAYAALVCCVSSDR